MSCPQFDTFFYLPEFSDEGPFFFVSLALPPTGKVDHHPLTEKILLHQHSPNNEKLFLPHFGLRLGISPIFFGLKS